MKKIRFKDITGLKFGKLTAIKPNGRYKDKHVKWLLKCDCGNLTTASHSNLRLSKVKSCGCYKKQTYFNQKWQGVGSLGKDHFSSIKRNALSRKLEFSITLEYISKLFDEQKGKCALSGKIITLSTNRKKMKPTASLDRIDNSIGYTPENVQWVHREVNISKNVLSNEEFISMCKEISVHNRKRIRPTICVSGGFDPVHIGHIRMFNAANEIGDVIVIVNSDNFLKKKKGKPFMELKERIEVIKNIKAVSAVIPCIDRDMTVRKTLELIKPDIFANGGDRNKKNIPETEVCNRLGIKMVFNVGGRKIQSSSKLINGI